MTRKILLVLIIQFPGPTTIAVEHSDVEPVDTEKRSITLDLFVDSKTLRSKPANLNYVVLYFNHCMSALCSK